MSTFKFFFTTHKWIGIFAAILVANTTITGFMLLIKKKVEWIQPAEHKGVEPGVLTVTFDQMLEAVKANAEMGVSSWDDVDRIDVRPGKGMAKVRNNHFWEAQVDLRTGEVMSVDFRRSDFIETIHDGSFFGEAVHGWLMPAYTICLLYLAVSGLIMWIEPMLRKRRRKKRQAAAVAGLTSGRA
jgi:uncharacterized iron-regulated membrane protein